MNRPRAESCAVWIAAARGACLVLAAAGGVASAQVAPMQFRVNSTGPGVMGTGFDPPSVALGTGSADQDRLHVAWSELGQEVDQLSECATACDSLPPGPLGGRASIQGLTVLRRRFSAAGMPIDMGDELLMERPPTLATAAPKDLTLAIQRQPTGAVASGRAQWGLSWGWGQYWPTGCPNDCEQNAVAVYGTSWTGGSPDPLVPANFAQPQVCEAIRSTTAFGSQQFVRAWVGVEDNCPVLRASVNSGSPLMLRHHYVGRDISGLDLAAANNDRFVLVFTECLGDPDSTLSSIKYVRFDNGVPGPVISVAFSDGHAPSVVAFDDGSFAVAYYDFGVPGQVPAGLKVQAFDSVARANPIGTPISVDDPLGTGMNYEIIGRGPSANSPLSDCAVVWMPAPETPSGVVVPAARRVQISSRSAGARFQVPIAGQGPEGSKRMAKAGQNPAAIRSDEQMVVGWLSDDQIGNGIPGDGNLYVTIRPLPVGTCATDVDDGTGTGVPDGGVGIEDLLYYLTRYELGVACADVDSGNGLGVPDGGVGIEDLLYFLGRYSNGC